MRVNPVPESTMLAHVLDGDEARVRRHAWELWAVLVQCAR